MTAILKRHGVRTNWAKSPDETDDPETRRDVKGLTFRDGAPGHEPALGIVARAVRAVEIDAPFRVRAHRFDAHRGHGDTDVAGPDAGRRVHARRVREMLVAADVGERCRVLVNLRVEA